jgi:hypothetical protein
MNKVIDLLAVKAKRQLEEKADLLNQLKKREKSFIINDAELEAYKNASTKKPEDEVFSTSESLEATTIVQDVSSDILSTVENTKDNKDSNADFEAIMKQNALNRERQEKARRSRNESVKRNFNIDKKK